MKTITTCAILALTMAFFSCSPEEHFKEDAVGVATNANFRVQERQNSKPVFSNDSRNVDGSCLTVNLIAGQNHIAGEVSVTRDGDDLIITYLTNSDWNIEATHLSIGNCDDQIIPTTGSGNPKVGRFEHSSEHSTGVNEVTYILDASVLDNNYCFAAHSEVSGPTGGETAWAEGTSFDGNNWAMFVEALLSDCSQGEVVF